MPMKFDKKTISTYITRQYKENNGGLVECIFCAIDWEEQGRPIEWTPSKSMSISINDNIDGLLFNCYRAGCSHGRGFISLGDALLTSPSKKKEFTPKQYKYRTITAKRKYLSAHVNLTQEEIDMNGIKYAIDRGTYGYPILNREGYITGMVDRSYTGRKPKSINYMFNEGDKLHYPKSEMQSAVVLLVEDIPSAIIGSRYRETVALLGTHLSLGDVKKLRSHTRHLAIALDPDASAKALVIARKYSIFFDSIDVLFFPNDLKDCTHKEIIQVLGEK